MRSWIVTAEAGKDIKSLTDFAVYLPMIILDINCLIFLLKGGKLSYSLVNEKRGEPALLTLPIPVSRALRKVGHDIKDARRRRRLPMSIVIQRASISEPTLIRIEKGDPRVAIGSYATVLFVLGMADRLADLVDLKNDPVGLQLEEENLPKRIRGGNKQKAHKEK